MPYISHKIFSEDSLLHTILSSLQQAVLITTHELNAPHPIIIYANQYLLDITGYDRDEIIGNSPRILQGEETCRDFLHNLREQLEAGNSFVGETTNYRKDGTPYHVEINISPLRDETGEIRYFLSIHRDLDAEKALKAAQSETDEYKLQLETQKKLSATFTNFVNGFAQQLRDPLAVIRLNSETMLRYNTKLEPTALTNKTNTIMREVDYITELIADISTISELSQSQEHQIFALKLSAFDLCIMTTDIIRRLKMQFPQRADDLSFSCSSMMQSVKLDFRLLRYIITHLIVNALTYSDKNTPIEINLNQCNKRIIFEVCDQGSGIPMSSQSQIFEPFYRASSAAGTFGTGLGLTIVKTSVNSLGGQLYIDSQEGIGTNVTVIIPMEQTHDH